MVVAAEMKYIVFRPKLWMYLATKRVDTSLKQDVVTDHQIALLILQTFYNNEAGTLQMPW